MAYETPITISKAITNIQKKKYVLPAIQREFVWDNNQIEMLFDSLMRDYPIGTFLFWKVERENISDFQFYEFLNNYPEMKDSDFLNTPEFLENFDLAFFVINREGELLFANQKTSNFFPYTTDEFNIFEKIISPTRSDIFESLLSR